MKEEKDGREEASTEEQTFRYSARIEPGGDGPEPVVSGDGIYYFRSGVGKYQGAVMWGLLENSAEVGMAENMSLESGYARWKQGGMRAVIAIFIANNRPCECGNAQNNQCFNSAHQEMRDEMRGMKIVAGDK